MVVMRHVLNAIAARLTIPIVLLMILAMVILPLPPILLDTFFTFNIMLAIVVLLVSSTVSRVLDFSIFPSLLLVATLLRLTLNVASTRIVLLEGHNGGDAAGKVIQSFGEVVIGRNDTRFKYSEGKVDNFNETQADIAQLLPGQDRLGDTLTYTSKSFSGAQLSLTYAPKDDSANNEAGFAATIIYGDRGLKNKDYYVAISHVDSLNNINATRIAGVLKQAQWQFGAIYQRSESIDGSKSGNGYVVSASYKMGQWVPKVQFASDDSQLRHANDGSQWTGGVDYVFDKQTTAYLFYTDLDLDHQSDSSLALGLKYKF